MDLICSSCNGRKKTSYRVLALFYQQNKIVPFVHSSSFLNCPIGLYQMLLRLRSELNQTNSAAKEFLIGRNRDETIFHNEAINLLESCQETMRPRWLGIDRDYLLFSLFLSLFLSASLFVSQYQSFSFSLSFSLSLCLSLCLSVFLLVSLILTLSLSSFFLKLYLPRFLSFYLPLTFLLNSFLVSLYFSFSLYLCPHAPFIALALFFLSVFQRRYIYVL